MAQGLGHTTPLNPAIPCVCHRVFPQSAHDVRDARMNAPWLLAKRVTDCFRSCLLIKEGQRRLCWRPDVAAQGSAHLGRQMGRKDVGRDLDIHSRDDASQDLQLVEMVLRLPFFGCQLKDKICQR